MTTPSIPFYKTGGTLDYNHPSYIERTADQELYEKLKQGEFCYILTSRQMGKSSLMVRTALRLRGEGESVVTIDLTSFGNTLEREQWYDSILSRIGQQLQLESELEDFWFNHERLSPFQRWMEAISRVVLPKCPGRLILFIDEIDIVRSFNFSADEFFAGIRECYNRRAEDPEMNRLVFCLLGVLSPSELIQDAGITPFNIGQRIELNDFSLEESALLAKGLNRKQPLAGKLIERIIYWTGGHPYLTQSLCAAVARDDQVQNPRSVDRLCRKLFLTSSAIEKEDNLVFVRERLLQSKLDRAGLLNLYHQILDGKKVPDDDANPFINVLKLTGLIKATNGILQVRNRIYRKVFEHEWMRENMPDAELRRQKAAYRQGVIRTAVIACAAFILAGTGLYIYYDSTFVTHEKYYNAVIERRGVVEGFYHVPKRDVPKRIRTYKLFLKGGKVQKYQIVNCYDAPVPIERAENYFLNSQETSTDTYHQIEYIYDAKGQVVYKKFLDQSGRFLGGFVFSPASNQSRARGYYVGKDGYPKTWGEAEYVNIEWSKEGYEHKVLYVDRYGQPQPGRDRAYGILKEYYSNGLEKRLISLNADEQNIIDDYGNAIAECIYDNNNGEQKSKNLFYNLLYAKKCHGNVIESRLLDVKEKLILAKNNFAITRLTYDSFDNGITQTYYDTQNKPITSTDGFFMSTTQLIRGPKKKTYSVKNSYFDTQQVPLLVEGIYHTLECRYDQNGGFEWLYYDINNKPVSYDAVNWEQLKGQAFSPYLLSNIAYMYEFGTEVKQSSQEAVRWYSKGAVNGSPWSMYKLGEMYFNGRGVKKDCNEALNWYRQSAAVGEISAMNDLGDIYYNGNQVKQNYAEAFIWYRQGAETGDSTAMENLAWMYQKGYGVDQNYLEALNWYRKAAKAGNANSMEKIGELYFYGYGVSNNYTKAIEWFRQGAEAGNSRAMTFLGFMYQNGYGVKQDYAEALSWYRMGAEAKNAMAMYAVGQIYYNGYGATKDFKEAAKWYRMGAKYGDSLSMNDLGEMYQNGDGVKRDYKEALKWYQKGAENGNDSAMNNIGDLYYYGRGVKQDYSKAVEWYLKGANAGNTSALHNLGWMYENGYGVNQDYIEALKWYLHGAENGKASSMEKIGEIYLNGYGVPKDNPKAVEWFLKGAKAGNSESMTYLGLMYQKGAGVEQDYTEALKWYQKAAEDNDAMAMYAVGQIYYNGYGVKEDYKEAAKWFRKGADLGDSSSMNKLGEIYQNGYGVKQNYAEALKWYQKGADNGNDSAMNSLGSMYQKGYGVKQDYATAVKWYQKGAEKGNASAMNNLGDLYYFGNGVKQDYSKAVQWYRQGAENGKAISMYNLGWMYQNGYGINRDYQAAAKCYQLGAENGSSLAMSSLGDLYYAGAGVKQDYTTAALWYKKAADNGSASAMNDLGDMYYDGKGVMQDYTAAITWYQKGAENDNASSMNDLGDIYYYGKGVDQDYKEAVAWYRKAANADSGLAMSNLGWMYQKGYSVKQDYTEAIKWYQKGADAGNGNAMYYLGQMYENGYGVKKSKKQAIDWYRKAADKDNKGAQERLQALESNTSPQSIDYLIIAGEVFPDSQAEKKGVRKGDIILEYENWSLFGEQSFDELTKTIDKYKNKAKHLKILRGSHIIDYRFSPGLIGINMVDSKASAEEVNRVRKIYEQSNRKK